MGEIELKEDEYLKDGLPYCKSCHTPRGMLWDDRIIHFNCRCRQEQQEREEAQMLLAERRRKVEEYRRNSELGKYFAHCTFENARPTKLNHTVYSVCRRYCEKAEEMLLGGYGMYIYGAPGVGKTHLIACMGNALTDKLYRVLFTSFVKLEGALKANFGNNTAQAQLLQATEDADFLFLDDLGTENIKEGSSTWLQSVIFDVINRRYNAKKPIICTSNYAFSDLIERTNYEPRTVHRLKEICSYYTQLDCEIMRDSVAEQKRKNMMKLLGGN